MAENGDVNGPLMVENCSITMLAYQRVYSMIDWYWCVYDIYIYFQLVWYRIYVKIGVYDCMLYRYVYNI